MNGSPKGLPFHKFFDYGCIYENKNIIFNISVISIVLGFVYFNFKIEPNQSVPSVLIDHTIINPVERQSETADIEVIAEKNKKPKIYFRKLYSELFSIVGLEDSHMSDVEAGPVNQSA